MSEIIDFYRGKNILITGATGFLGKLLVEKLLRLCDVGKIYILIRDKKGLKAEQRLDGIFDVPVYDRLRQSNPDFLSFIKLVKGDVSLPGLGLGKDVRAMLVEEIDIVFHGAATVNFDEPIERATTVNVCGTKEIALLCQDMKHLKALVHISTAFSNCPKKKVAEQFYDPPLKADELINLCSKKNSTIATIKRYLEGWPNTYAFTKCVAEDAIKTYAVGIPTCIVRPAVIICTKTEPIEGWIDNYYGSAGYIATIMSGVMRVACMDIGATAEFVPADMCTNVIIAACHNIAKSGFIGEAKIINFTSSTQNRLTYGKVLKYILEAARQIPSSEALWYPKLIVFKSSFLFSSLSIVYHHLPAVIMDIILMVFLKRPKALRTSLKLEKFVNALSYFTHRSWMFSNDNLTSLWKELNSTDKVLFDFDVNQIDWREMMTINARGVRKYLLKQREQTLPTAKKRMYWLSVIDKTLHAFIILLVSIGIAKYLNLF